MDENSMWLQGSICPPEGNPLSLAQVEEEISHPPAPTDSVGKNQEPSNADLHFEAPPLPEWASQPAPTLLPPQSSSGSSLVAIGGGLSAPATPRPRTPASSQPMPRGGRMSLASADFYLQQQHQQVQDELKRCKRQLDDAQEETAVLTNLLDTEKRSVNEWRARHKAEVAAGDEAAAASLSKQRRLAGERDDLSERLTRLETEYTTARTEWERTVEGKVAAALRQPLEDLARADQEREHLLGRLADLEDARDHADEAQTIIAQLKTAAAEHETELQSLRAQVHQAQRQVEDVRVEAEAELRSRLATVREEHFAEYKAVEADAARRIESAQADAAEAVAVANQRTSEGERTRNELRVLQRDNEGLRDQVAANEAELLSAREAERAARRRHEEQRAAAEARLQEEHDEAVRRLTAEHADELAGLRTRLSRSDAATDRACRLEVELTAERDRTEELRAELDTRRVEAEEARRTILRRDAELEEAVSRATDAEVKALRTEESLSEKFNRERKSLHERIEQLLTRNEQQNRDHHLEEEGFAEQLADARARQSEAEEAMTELRSEFNKQRMSLIQNEGHLRSELAELTADRDDALRAKRRMAGELEEATAEVSALRQRLQTNHGDLQSALDRADGRIEAVKAEHREHVEDLESRIRRLEEELQQRLEANTNHQRTTAPPSMVEEEGEGQAEKCADRLDDDDDSASPSESAKRSLSFTRPSLPAPPGAGVRRARAAPTPSPAPAMPSTTMDHYRHRSHDVCGTPGYEPAEAARSSRRGALADASPNRVRSCFSKNATAESRRPSLDEDAERATSKRHRSEERRESVLPPPPHHHAMSRHFAVTGCEGHSVQCHILRLPDAEIVQVASNAPIPSTVTHLVTSGVLTIKLLCALVRGCWVLPESYVTASVAAGQWLPEPDYGFRHTRPLLKGRTLAFTAAFQQSRHCTTASLVLREAGAHRVDSMEELEEGRYNNPSILATPSEVAGVRAANPACIVATWDSLVKTIYPPGCMPQPPQRS